MRTIFDDGFKPYGFAAEGYDFTELLRALEETTERPDARVIYKPSEPKLESLQIFAQLRDRLYGGMPIQIGYCNGANRKLNCLEYHRGSELCVAADEIVLIVAKLSDVIGGELDTSKAECFAVPRGAGAFCYETTLHYAPAKADGSFRTVIVLPRGTNTEKPDIAAGNAEDARLAARNKWLIAHPDTNEAKNGAYVGLTGENIELR